MAIFERGLSQLKPSASLEDTEVRKRLMDIACSLNTSTDHQFSYFRRVQDPSFLYLLGQWESLDSRKSMHKSEKWKQFVNGMASYFEFKWVAHYEAQIDGAKADAGLLEVQWFYMKTDLRAKFEQELEARVRDTTCDAIRIAGGWRMDTDRGEEEYVAVLAVDDAEKSSALSERLRPSAEGDDRQQIRRLNPST